MVTGNAESVTVQILVVGFAARGAGFVRLPVAVVVLVVAGFHRTGVDRLAAVVAIPADGGGVGAGRRAPALAVGTLSVVVAIRVFVVHRAPFRPDLVALAIAVIVLAVAYFHRTGVDTPVAVVAVAADVGAVGPGRPAQALLVAVDAITIAVAVLVKVGAGGRALVHLAVAVVVLGVAQFRSIGVDIGRLVVAITGAVETRIGCADHVHSLIAVAVIIVVAPVVGRAAAVIVQVIADVGHCRMHGIIQVVTVAPALGAYRRRAHGGHTIIAVVVVVLVAAVVNAVETIVILVVALLRGARVDQFVVVVAVAPAVEAHRRRPLHNHGGGTVTVVVLIAPLVDARGTVVVNVVTLLLHIRILVKIEVVTVPTLGRSVFPVRHAQTTLVSRIAVGVIIGVPVEISTSQSPVLIRDAIAVIVQSVALFRGSGLGVRIAVVAIPRHEGGIGAGSATQALAVVGNPKTVIVKVLVMYLTPVGPRLIDVAVTVVVEVVAHLARLRIDLGVGVIAIPGGGRGVVPFRSARALLVVDVAPAVFVQVQVVVAAPNCSLLVYLVIAVVVYLVAFLLCSRIDKFIAVIAVAQRLGSVEVSGFAQALLQCDVAVTILVPVEEVGFATAGARFVRLAIAIVVHAVAHFCSLGRDSTRPIVAVTAGGSRVVPGRRAQALGITVEPIPVIVGVLEEEGASHRIGFVHLCVAVIVHTVTELRAVGEDHRILVVAVVSLHRLVRAVGLAEAFVVV